MNNVDFDRYVFLVLDLLKQLGTELMAMTEPNAEEKQGEEQKEQKDGDGDKESEYVDNLRTSLLECYTAIIQGLRVGKKHDLVLSSLDTIHTLLKHCAAHFADENQKASWECKKAAWGLLLDLGQTYGLCNNQCKKIFLQPFVLLLIDIGKTGDVKASLTKPVGDGLVRALGTTRGYTNLYYCGRRLGVRAIPGSDGQCGPNNGPQCTDCIKYQQEQGYLSTMPDDNKLSALHMESIVKELQSVESAGSSTAVGATNAALYDLKCCRIVTISKTFI